MVLEEHLSRSLRLTGRGLCAWYLRIKVVVQCYRKLKRETKPLEISVPALA